MASAKQDAFALVRPNLTVSAANTGFADMVGLPRVAVIGASGELWTDPRDMPNCIATFVKAFASGEPVIMVRRLVISENRTLFACADLIPIQGEHEPLILARNRILAKAELVKISEAADVSDYVSDMAQSLASMASNVGLSSLQEALERVESEAKAIKYALGAEP